MSEIYRLTYTRKREIFQGKEPTVLLTAAHGGTYSFTADVHDMMMLFDGERTNDDILTDFYKQKNISLERSTLENFSAGLIEEGLLERIGEDGEVISIEEDVINSTVREVAGVGRSADPLGRKPTSANDDALDDSPDDSDKTVKKRALKPAHAESIEELRQEIERSRPKIRVPLWSKPMTPFGFLLSLPARSDLVLIVLLVAVMGALFGVLSSWDAYYDDLRRLLGSTNLIQAMLISLLAVNLSTQLAKASIFRTETGVTAPFGIALFAWVLPRFYADTVDIQFIRDRRKRMRLRGSDLVVLLFLFVVFAVGWMSSNQSSTFLPLIFAWGTVVSAVTFLLQLNPLVKGAGYDVMSAGIGTGDLRQRALTSLVRFRERPRGWGNREETPYPLSIRMYGLFIVAFILLICYAAFVFVGPWFEERLGGVGVLIFLAAVTVGLVSPLWGAWRKAKHVDKATKALSAHQSRYSEKKSRLRPALITLFLLGGSIFVGLLPYVYEPGGEFVILPAERVDVRALIPGEVRRILIKEGEVVEPGQIIAHLSDDESRSSVVVSEAKLKELNARLRLLVGGASSEEVNIARQRVKTAQTKAKFSQQKADRYESLAADGTVAQNNYDTVLVEAEVDLAYLEEARLNLAKLEASAKPDEVAVLESEIEQQEALLEYNRGQLEYATLRSPIQGRIVSGSLEFSVGDFLREGDLLVTVEKTGNVMAAISVPQVDIGEVRVGERVRLKPWSYPDQEFYGEVTRIAPAAEVKEYGKVIRVITTLNNEDGLLKSEMTGHAKIRGETQPVAIAFTRMLHRFVVVEIWSWLP